jgi:signal peptide peptidase SppA
VVPVVRLTGAIGMAMPLRPGLSLQTCAGALERAFSLPGARAVAVVINSPGGSPVQSHLIHQRIRALAAEKKLPVVAFVEDAAASGGYMLACAADEIFADPSSIVGSIGVVSAGFGFDRLIERFGVERRIHTVGKSKALLDPFSPERPDDVARLKEVQKRVYDMFVALVRERRGARLREEESEDLFSGAIWAGQDALGLGLIDGLGDVRSVMRQRFGEKVQLRVISAARPGLFSRLLRRIPGETGLAADTLSGIEERAWWARIGF